MGRTRLLSGTQQLSSPKGRSRQSVACAGPAGVTALPWRPMAKPTVGATLFVDYENASWYASQLPADCAGGHFDPVVLGEAICGRLRVGSAVEFANLELGRVRVYRREPIRRREVTERRRWHNQAVQWNMSHGERVLVRNCPTGFSKTGSVVKELHAHLTVDLLTWSREARAEPSDSQVAILFSADRECVPVVERITCQFGPLAFPRIVLASWTGMDKPIREFDRILKVDVARHCLPWNAYREAANTACKAKYSSLRAKTRRRRRARKTQPQGGRHGRS